MQYSAKFSTAGKSGLLPKTDYLINKGDISHIWNIFKNREKTKIYLLSEYKIHKKCNIPANSSPLVKVVCLQKRTT